MNTALIMPILAAMTHFPRNLHLRHVDPVDERLTLTNRG